MSPFCKTTIAVIAIGMLMSFAFSTAFNIQLSTSSVLAHKDIN